MANEDRSFEGQWQNLAWEGPNLLIAKAGYTGGWQAAIRTMIPQVSDDVRLLTLLESMLNESGGFIRAVRDGSTRTQ